MVDKEIYNYWGENTYENEISFLDDIEKCLKDNNCKTWREVIPDACKDWKRPYKVDLIFYRNDLGYIGVEGKNTNTLRSGGKIANGINQIIKKYKPQTYFSGTTINKWAIVVPLKTIWDNGYNEEISTKIKSEIIIFLRGFLNHLFNISLLEYYPEYKWKETEIIIDSYTKKVIKIGGKGKYYKNG